MAQAESSENPSSVMDCILIATSVFSRYLAQLICQNVDEIDSAVVLFVVWLLCVLRGSA